MTAITRKAIAQAIQTFYDAEVLGYYPINLSTVSDIKDEETKLYKRSVTIGGFAFHTRLGLIYQNMKSRCLVGGSLQRNQPHYAGATICKEWADSFDAFAEWAASQIGMYQVDERGELFHLDSDLLLEGGVKIYSPETCCFLPRAINVALTGRGSKGYYKTTSGKYQVKISKYGKSVCIGLFDEERQAIRAHKRARKAYIKALAKQYQHQLPFAVYDALLAYKQT
ncbi:hypothetical protein H8K38_16165 [Undibacterium sp. FT79W]|uniref:hypothetical protein n=1 Tax=Undibacterium sp. FT79W TaxID=2762296 RepID=UPI00164B8930|nr:hypothetical protein [Undibacterium sp. FT79W]MBC3879346.1 hypothetical protein [Undibacterium sp. FT79W]